METAHVSSFLVALGRSSIEAGIVVVLVLAAQWVFRKQLNPRWRCALWLLVVGRLLLPFSFGSATSVFNLLPHWTRLDSSSPVPVISITPATTISPAPPPPRTSAPSTPLPTLSASAVDQPRRSWQVWIFANWLAGAVLLAGHVMVSSLRLWRRCAKLQPLTQQPATAVLKDCCELLKLRTQPALLETLEVGSPALHGLFRQRLLLPKGFTGRFSLAELRFVFLHELAHLKRRDLLLNWVVAVLQVIHWFNPLVWFGFSRWRADRELACDAMALEAAGQEQNEHYGRTILRLLETFAHPMSTPGLVGILEDKRQLRRRIDMIASYVPTKRWSRLALLLAGGLAVIGLTDAQNRPQFPDNSIASSNTPRQKGYNMNKSNITNYMARAAIGGLLALTTPTTSVVLHAEDTTAAPATSQLAKDLIGTWVLVGTPGNVGEAPTAVSRFKFFTGKHWCITHSDTKNGVVTFHHGGTYALNGNEYIETVEYANPTTMNFIGKTNGHFTIKIEDDLLTLIGIDNPWKEVWKRAEDNTTAAAVPSQLAKGLIGTWVMVGTPGNVGEPPRAGGPLKLVTASHWVDTNADPKTGVVIYHHGGTYRLKGDEYIESVQYANPGTMNLIGQAFKFTIKLEGDTLTLTGIGNPWTEVWKRAK